MALRLEDEDERISNLAKLFFHELSKKGKLSLLFCIGDQPIVVSRLSV